MGPVTLGAMRGVLPWLLLGFLLGACSDPLTSIGIKSKPKKAKKGPVEPPEPPANCHLIVPDIKISEMYGVGGFHREEPGPGRRFLFDCEWRVDTVEAGHARRQVVY